jgi:protocatechuate 3,4-dioxygenase, beta subunit
MADRPNNVRLLARRQTLAALAGLPAAIATPVAAQPVTTGVRPTPRQTLGPFYPRNESEQPRETDADLLVVDGDRVRSRGEPLYLTGRVLDRSGQPVTNAMVEIWQCDANAIYHHPAGGAPAERDPNFQGYGRMQTGADGAFHFRTIRPVAYPGRTPHIHVRIAPRAGGTLATQLYLADEPGNARDFLFRQLSPEERTQLSLVLQPSSGAQNASHPLARATRWTARTDLVLA